jgi:hypothetical protein
LLPYTPAAARVFTPKESVIRDVKRIASACKFITVLDFVGGEPFVRPDLVEILSEVKGIPNIGIVNVFTNGTVVPGDSLCDALTDERVTVCLSSYARNLTDAQVERVRNTEGKLKSRGVSYFSSQNMTWFDCSSFESVGDDEETLKRRFSKCVLANCQRVDDGMMYRCLHQYAGAVTGKLKVLDECFSIYDCEPAALGAKLDWFNRLEYISACSYCKLPFHAEVVSSGVQLP